MELSEPIKIIDEFPQLVPSEFLGFQTPMMATLTDDYFDDSHWIYERKLDGVRCLITINDGKVDLYSRTQKNMSNTYPEIKEAIEKRNYPNLLVDGEIVAFDGKLTSFSLLQKRIGVTDNKKIKASGVGVVLYLFDIIYYDQYELATLTLESRKKILKQVMVWKSPIRYTSHKNEHGKKFFKEACQKQWEGLIAKNRNAKYVHSRSKNWLKFKCSLGQELVIGGFTEPQGSRIGFGAMLVGYYHHNQLMYAGKVGTGFDDEFLDLWRKNFEAIEIEESPFENHKNNKKGMYHWIKPKYVGQFGFTEWTTDNKLRHPRFLGMREDKNPKSVVKE